MCRLNLSTTKRLWAVLSGLLASVVSLALAVPPDAKDKKVHESSDDLFTNSIIRRISIEIPDDGMNTLRRYHWRRSSDTSDRVSVPATVRERGAVYTNVAIHLKGAAGSFRPVDGKPALTLNFAKWSEGQRFHGLQKISLNNSVQDPAYISEKLCRELYNRAGVPMPRADYAMVELNGRDLGLYVLTEGWDKTFLKRHFKNTQGNFYDPGLASDLSNTLPATSGENREDRSEINAVLAAAREPNLTNRISRLEKVLDLDRFISLLALDVLTWNWDGYPMNRNNYRVYNDLDTHRVVIFPHGLDQMFWRSEGPIATGTKGIVAGAVLQTPEGRRRYLERFVQFRTTLFDVPAMTRRVDALAARLRPAIGEAGFFERLGYTRAVSTLRNRIIERARSIDEQLEGSKKLVRLGPRESAPLSGWDNQVVAGDPVFAKLNAPSAALHITTKNSCSGAWFSTVWLEQGRYVVEGKIKTRAVVARPNDERGGAGLRVISQRKVSNGLSWDWFPYRESRDREARSEMPAPTSTSKKLDGTTDWTTVTYEFDLREPMADLEILCELRAKSGEAWFDLKSLKLTRQK
ncbi:MAG TPA: CotH kinase family protein [Verrucomicrobiae bacterium]|jgi:hypothetical protein